MRAPLNGMNSARNTNATVLIDHRLDLNLEDTDSYKIRVFEA